MAWAIQPMMRPRQNSNRGCSFLHPKPGVESPAPGHIVGKPRPLPDFLDQGFRQRQFRSIGDRFFQQFHEDLRTGVNASIDYVSEAFDYISPLGLLAMVSPTLFADSASSHKASADWSLHRDGDLAER